MTLLYTPAMLVFPYAAAFGLWGHGADIGIVGTLVTLHFAKRVLECLFIHRYSGTINVGSTLMITCIYLAAALGFLAMTTVARHPDQGQAPVGGSAAPGVAVFAAGQLGNGYHHWLLANLRKPGEKAYAVPKGGLFSLVCCPHYLFEVVAFVGLGLVTGHVGALSIAWTSAGYLAGRAFATMQWYEAKAKKGALKGGASLPAGWKRVIPFVF